MKFIFKNLSHFISILNVFSGFLSIIFSFYANFLNEILFYYLASMLICFSICFDFFDGYVARYFNQRNFFGELVDSFSDLISFGLAPSFFLFNILFGFYPLYPFPYHNYYFILGIFISFFYFLSVLIRLIYYHLDTQEKDNFLVYRGLASPYASLFFLMGAFFFDRITIIYTWFFEYFSFFPISFQLMVNFSWEINYKIVLFFFVLSAILMNCYSLKYRRFFTVISDYFVLSTKTPFFYKIFYYTFLNTLVVFFFKYWIFISFFYVTYKERNLKVK